MYNLHTFRYIHVHHDGTDMYVHVCDFMNMSEHVHSCLYHLQTRMYRFAQSCHCPGGQDSRCQCIGGGKVPSPDAQRFIWNPHKVFSWYIPGIYPKHEFQTQWCFCQSIWNPDHLDRIGQTCTYVSEHGTDMYVHVHTCS